MSKRTIQLLLTNFITVLGLVFSSWAVYQQAQQSPYSIVFSWALVGFVCDILDGFMARRWQVETKIGGLLDLIHDVILYVLLIIVVLQRIFSPSIWLSLALIIFTLSSTMRLVTFWQIGLSKDKNNTFYTGMPVYFNLFGLVLILHLHNLILLPSLFVAGMLVLSSGLMISDIRVHKPNLHQSLLAAVMLLALVIAL